MLMYVHVYVHVSYMCMYMLRTCLHTCVRTCLHTCVCKHVRKCVTLMVVCMRGYNCPCSSLSQHLAPQHPGASYEPVFSPSWKTREACLLRLRKTVIPILAPTSKSSANGNLSQSPCKDIVGACWGVVAYSLADPVVKVYLAAVVSGCV